MSHLGVMLGDLGAVLGLCWAILGSCCAHVGPSWSYVEPSWGHVGRSWGHVGPMLGHLGAMLGPCWAILGPSWAYVGPSWAILAPCSAYVGPSWAYVGPLLVRCWAVYVENIFRDNFLRFFPALKAKTMEKPIVFSRRRPCRRPSVGLRVDRPPCNLQCFLALNVTGPKNTVNYRGFCRHAALPRGRRQGRQRI